MPSTGSLRRLGAIPVIDRRAAGKENVAVARVVRLLLHGEAARRVTRAAMPGTDDEIFTPGDDRIGPQHWLVWFGGRCE